jgi:arginyl-tRNA synthetase
MEALEHSLGSLDLRVPIPEVKVADVFANPLDVCRTYLSQILADIAGCDIDIAYKSIQWPNNIFNGDLAVILPKLRPGAKADALAIELIEKVCSLYILELGRS